MSGEGEVRRRRGSGPARTAPAKALAASRRGPPGWQAWLAASGRQPGEGRGKGMPWAQDALWAKARSYMGKALAQAREGADFPFLASLALEFLARAALAAVHPSLLADPQDGSSILYACGIDTKTEKQGPKSIPASTVFARCIHVAEGFGEDDRKVCMALANMRNEELHSGGLPFDGLPTRTWLASFYRAAKKLAEAQGKTLSGFLGDDEAAAAERMIGQAEKDLPSAVKALIARCRKAFSELPPEEQADRSLRARGSSYRALAFRGRAVDCPACGRRAGVLGQLVRSQPPVLEGDDLVIREVYLPTDLECKACGLRLDSHAKLDAAGLGGQYSIVEELDPISYFGGVEADEAGQGDGCRE